MIEFQWQYPGDPIDVCQQMSRKEFLEAHPRQPIVVREAATLDELLNGGGKSEYLPVGPDEIQCDYCGEDPGNEIFVLYRGSKGICRECAERSVFPHRF